MPHERPGLAVRHGDALRLSRSCQPPRDERRAHSWADREDEDQDDENWNVPRSCRHPGTAHVTDDRKRKSQLRAGGRCHQLPSNHTRGGSASRPLHGRRIDSERQGRADWLLLRRAPSAISQSGYLSPRHWIASLAAAGTAGPPGPHRPGRAGAMAFSPGCHPISRIARAHSARMSIRAWQTPAFASVIRTPKYAAFRRARAARLPSTDSASHRAPSRRSPRDS
jgi:hypothetical protein